MRGIDQGGKILEKGDFVPYSPLVMPSAAQNEDYRNTGFEQ
jgi:hypothetical protein